MLIMITKDEKKMNDHIERLLNALEKTLEENLISLPTQYDVIKGQLFTVRLIKNSIESMKPIFERDERA